MKLPADAVATLRTRLDGRCVCVTGGAGFIGGHLCDALCSLGARVSVIDDLSNAETRHIAELIDLEPDRVRFVHGSILDDGALSDAMEDAEFVLHLAAVGSVQRSIAEPERTFRVNATGTLRVLEAARRARARRVVLAASSSAYGDGAALPARENAAPNPLSPYAASKVAAEQLMTVWARSFGLSTVSLRYFNVFGPRQADDSAYAAVVAAFIRNIEQGKAPVIYGDGSQTRDFTFVSNAVLATLLAATTDRPLAGEVCNIGIGRRVSVNDLARALIRLMDADVEPTHEPARPGDARHSLADIARARELLGYRPIATLEDGLEQTLAWRRTRANAPG